MQVNYQKLGFKCGLEIHQQLEGKKLFCSCPTLNSDAEPDVKFERRLRAVAGETGEVDIAAKHEMQKGKKFIYMADSNDTCLVEYDEEPPHELNKEALETALKVALLLNAQIVDEIQIMRKTVVDGSNVSGFQRTALIAQDGYINTSLGKVKIPTICLEEEAAQKLEQKDGAGKSEISGTNLVGKIETPEVMPRTYDKIDYVELIEEKIHKARLFLMDFRFDEAKSAYIEIMRMYTELEPKKKSKVYQDIKELYYERKSAEKFAK